LTQVFADLVRYETRLHTALSERCAGQATG
jgi:hypothetical protein